MVAPPYAMRRLHDFFQTTAINVPDILWKLQDFFDRSRVNIDQPIIKFLIDVPAVESEFVAALDGVYHQVGDCLGV